MKRPWIDTHVHVGDIGPDGQRREGLLEDLLDVLDRSDADLRFVISCASPHLRRGSKAEDLLRANRMIYDLVREAPDRLYGSCIINPHFLEESLRVMDVCFGEWGFVQLGEMLQSVQDYKMNSPAVETVLRRAIQYDVPVQVHLGTYWYKEAPDGGPADGMNQMGDFLRAVSRVPEAKYVLAHAIGCGPTAEFVSWADMYLDALASLFTEFPRNFWIEIRDFHCKALRRALSELPTDRLLAGTDWTTALGPPFQSYGTMFNVKETDNPFPASVGSFVGFLRDAGASNADISRIAFDNAKDLYGIGAR